MCFVESSKQTKTVAELLFTRSVLSMLNINMQQYKNNVNYNSLVDDINKINENEMPKPKKSKICRKCAYFEFCFS